MINDIAVFEYPKSAVSEAYRTLRSNLQFSLMDKESSIIAVTSCSPGEGKSTVVSNLAMVMAESGKKTLLIDCDLRKPTIHKRFGISNSHGLTSLLLKKSALEQGIHFVGIENLRVIPSGPLPPNPSEILGSKNMKDFLGNLRESFDLILIDTPPILGFSDVFALAPSIDGNLLVAVYGSTEKAAILRAKDAHDKAGATILGIVENKIPENAIQYGYGYGYSSKYYNSYY